MVEVQDCIDVKMIPLYIDLVTSGFVSTDDLIARSVALFEDVYRYFGDRFPQSNAFTLIESLVKILPNRDIAYDFLAKRSNAVMKLFAKAESRNGDNIRKLGKIMGCVLSEEDLTKFLAEK